LQQGITPTGNFEVARIDKLGLNLELKKYKHQNGTTNFLAIREIPEDQRLYSLAKQNLGEAIKLIAVALTYAFESMNLTRPMNAFQILDLAEVIVEESESDKLALQDVLIFLQRLTRGQYPGLYEGIDCAKFLERFALYRDERWDEMRAIRDAENEFHKRLGDDNYHDRNNLRDASPLGLQLEHYKKKVQEKSDARKESKRYR